MHYRPDRRSSRHPGAARADLSDWRGFVEADDALIAVVPDRVNKIRDAVSLRVFPFFQRKGTIAHLRGLNDRIVVPATMRFRRAVTDIVEYNCNIEIAIVNRIVQPGRRTG